MTKCWYAYYYISLSSKYTKSIQYDCQKRVCDRFTEVKQRKGTRNGCFFLFLSSSFFLSLWLFIFLTKAVIQHSQTQQKSSFLFFLIFIRFFNCKKYTKQLL
jgi:hypothetical protein